MRHLLTVSVVLCAVFAFVYGDFREDALNLQNRYRAQHHSPPLTLSRQLDNYAQNWAQQMANSHQLRHSHGPYGENIYTSGDHRLTDSEVVIQAINSWFKERSIYDYRAAMFTMSTGHFTQGVWWGSKFFGIGVARSSSGVYVCANYDPRGNVEGQFHENVRFP